MLCVIAIVSELGLGSLMAMSYYSMRHFGSTGNVGKLNMPWPLFMADESGEFNNISDVIFHSLLDDSFDVLAQDIFNGFPITFSTDLPVTSAENYSSVNLPGKLCMECMGQPNFLPRSWNHTAVLRTMKYSRQSGSPFFTVPEFRDMDRIFSNLTYPSHCRESGTCRHSDPLILGSYFKAYNQNYRSSRPQCHMFFPVLSNAGLAYTFSNPSSFWDTLKKSASVHTFDEEFRDGMKPMGDSCRRDPSGPGNQLYFDLRQSYIEVLTNAKTTFKVAIHSPDDIPVEFNSLSPGYRYVTSNY